MSTSPATVHLAARHAAPTSRALSRFPWDRHSEFTTRHYWINTNNTILSGMAYSHAHRLMFASPALAFAAPDASSQCPPVDGGGRRQQQWPIYGSMGSRSMFGGDRT